MTINNIQYSIPENEYFEHPKNNNIKKLGIFYTNNNIPSVVEYCLKDLIKFENKADIVSCVWQKIEGNPFNELIAYTKHSHHLNIIIQILQLLYFAQNNKDYDYVSFLEHDVLYPDDYFDFSGIDNHYQGLVNENYIGLSKKGFQKKNQHDLPLHQTIMRFDNAIIHFEKLILKAVKERSVILEPTLLQKRQCKNPSLHINHGAHFTSHFNIYSTTNVYQEEYLWGDGIQLYNKITL